MENCLVTMLKGVVNNDNLKILGALDLKVKYNSTLNLGVFTILDGEVSKVKILGDTNVVFTKNNNKEIDWNDSTITKLSGGVEDEIVTIRIENKYKLRSVVLSVERYNQYMIVDIDLNELIVCPEIKGLVIHNASPIDVPSSFIEKFIQTHIGKLQWLTLQKSSIDIDTLLICKDTLSNLVLTGSNSTGNISKLKEFSLLTYSDWGQVCNNTWMYGDVSTIPNHVIYFNLPTWRMNPDLASYAGLTWTAGSRTGSGVKILVLNSSNHSQDFATNTDVDNYFIDNANCDWGGGVDTAISVWVNDTYTPSADATTAIATLKSKGVTSVKVNNIAL